MLLESDFDLYVTRIGKVDRVVPAFIHTKGGNVMKKWVALALGTGLVLSAAQGASAENPEKKDKTKWKLVWSDEFSKSEIDQTKWNFDTGNRLKDAEGTPVTPG